MFSRIARTFAPIRSSSYLRTISRDAHNHVGIIGAGSVGTACASFLMSKTFVDEITLFDMNVNKATGEALDLQDTAFKSGTKVHSVEHVKQLEACDIIVVTAGVGSLPGGGDRLKALPLTAKIMQDIFSKLKPKPSAIVIVVSNPVDVCATYVRRLLADVLPTNQVIGSGTYLDTQRLRVKLSQRLLVQPGAIHAYVMGEHGDSQFAPSSIVRVGGCTLPALGISEEEYQVMSRETAKRAYDIIQKKGNTCHGIGECVAAICGSILSDHKDILSVSAYNPTYDMYVGWPCRIGREGIEKLMPLDLLPHETAKLEASIATLRNSWNLIK